MTTRRKREAQKARAERKREHLDLFGPARQPRDLISASNAAHLRKEHEISRRFNKTVKLSLWPCQICKEKKIKRAPYFRGKKICISCEDGRKELSDKIQYQKNAALSKCYQKRAGELGDVCPNKSALVEALLKKTEIK